MTQDPQSEGVNRYPSLPGQRFFLFNEENMPKTKTEKKNSSKRDKSEKVIELPVADIKIILRGPDPSCDGAYSYRESEIDSDLKEYDSKDDEDAPQFWGAMHGIENMVLAHAVAGIDVKSAAYLEGLETAIRACEKELF